MITTVANKYLRNRTKNVSFWGCARFSFSVEENRLTVPISFWRKFLAALNFFVHLANTVFVLARLLQYRFFNNGPELDDQSKVLLELGCLVQLVSPFCQHLCFFKKEEAVASFINQYLAYFRSIEDTSQQSKMEKVYEYLLKFITLMGNALAPMYISIAIFKPATPMFLSSLSSTSSSLSILARVVYSLPFAYITFTWWSNLLFMGNFLGYIFSILDALHDLQSERIAWTSIQRAGKYRCLQLLQKEANEILKYPFATIKVLFLLATIRCLYGVVNTDGYMRVFNANSALCYVVFLVVFFKALGQVYELSQTVLKTQRRMGGKWFKRFHRSCWPLKFEIAGMYFVDLPMSLTMGSFIIQNVANMLIMGHE